MKKQRYNLLNVIGVVASIVSLVLSVGLILAGNPLAAAIAGGTLILVWCLWVTISIIRLQERQYFRAIEWPPAIPEEKFSLCIGEAQRVDSRDQKFRVPSDILKWDTATILFWVDLNDELASSGNNRYLFSYTTDVLDSAGHPNGFYLSHCGRTSRWEFRFYRDPSEKTVNCIAFENAPNILGIRLVAIRWCRQERYCELLLDAGISFRKRITLSSWASWPCASSEAIHFGGWRDNWDGGLSRTLFTSIRIYDQLLSDKELLTIYKKDKKKTCIYLVQKIKSTC